MAAERERRAGALNAARSVRDEARARLQRAASAIVASSIEALAEHLPAANAMRPQTGPDAAERTRTVLAIDRSTRAQASPPAPRPAPRLQPAVAKPVPRPPEPTADAAPPCDEPIRTRSMARLLAKQGHPSRALAILEYLARSGADAELQAEIEALRAAIAAG